MSTSRPPKIHLIKLALLSVMLLSILALIYHIRWFIPFLQQGMVSVVPAKQEPLIWFIVQISNNLIFLFVCFSTLKMVHTIQESGFFDKNCLNILDNALLACVALAFLGAFKLAFSSFNDMSLSDIDSFWAGVNISLRFVIDIVTFKEPQTMYFLLSIMLWSVKQFASKALFIKSENESFI